MRNRSMAIVVRDGAVLMEEIYFEGRHFFTLPGGGIEEGETPEETALREMKSVGQNKSGKRGVIFVH